MAMLIHNRKASFNYEILERFEAGIELLGPEVKSLRKGQGVLDGAMAVLRGLGNHAGQFLIVKVQ